MLQLLTLLQCPWLNWSLEVQGGALTEQCGEQLSDFFARCRDEKKRLKQAAKAN